MAIETVEYFRHQIPGGAHVEGEPVAAEHSRSSADILVFLDNSNLMTVPSQQSRCRKPADASAYDRDSQPGFSIGPLL